MRACGYDRMFAEDVILRTYGCDLTYAAEQAPNGLLLWSPTADVILSTDMMIHMPLRLFCAHDDTIKHMPWMLFSVIGTFCVTGIVFSVISSECLRPMSR